MHSIQDRNVAKNSLDCREAVVSCYIPFMTCFLVQFYFLRLHTCFLIQMYSFLLYMICLWWVQQKKKKEKKKTLLFRRMWLSKRLSFCVCLCTYSTVLVMYQSISTCEQYSVMHTVAALWLSVTSASPRQICSSRVARASVYQQIHRGESNQPLQSEPNKSKLKEGTNHKWTRVKEIKPT